MPLNVLPDSDTGRGHPGVGSAAQDSPRRDSTYQVAARSSTSRSSSHSSLLDAASKDGQAKFELKSHAMTLGWQRAAASYFEENLLEQKMWIQCTLKGAKQRGADWIDAKFRDEKQSNSGCSACLPDIVVVNDNQIKKGTDAFRSKAAAPWQRVWTPAQAEIETKRSYSASPAVTNSMLCGATPANSDTYLYDDKRFGFFLFRCTSFCTQLSHSSKFAANMSFTGLARGFSDSVPSFT